MSNIINIKNIKNIKNKYTQEEIKKLELCGLEEVKAYRRIMNTSLKEFKKLSMIKGIPNNKFAIHYENLLENIILNALIIPTLKNEKNIFEGQEEFDERRLSILNNLNKKFKVK